MLLLLIRLAPALAIVDEPVEARPYSLPQIEDRIASHRQLVRMCGPLSALRSAALHGNSIDVESVLSRYADENKQGVEVRDVIQACRQSGLKARGVQLPRSRSRGTPSALRRLPVPCILLIDDDQHCIVLESVLGDARSARIWDPSDLRPKLVCLEALSERWAGKAIIFEPLNAAIWILFEVLGWTASLIMLVLLVCRWQRKRSRHPCQTASDGYPRRSLAEKLV